MEKSNNIQRNFLLIIILLIFSVVIVGLLFNKTRLKEKIDQLQKNVDDLGEEKITLNQELNQAKTSGVEIDKLKTEKIILNQELLHAKASTVKMDISNFPSAELWIDKEQLIHRSEVKNDNGQSISWVIIYNGTVVLKRNARSETQYKYYIKTPGIYTVYLEQFVNGEYRVISNVISYKIS